MIDVLLIIFFLHTLPHALQWCLLKVTLNSAVHTWHMVTRWSGIQTGACKEKNVPFIYDF